MALTLTIAAVTKAIQVGSLYYTQTANGRGTLSIAVRSLDASYRPAMDAEVLLVEDGTRIFGGLVERPRERGIVIGRDAFITTISAVDFNSYAERRYVNDTIPAGTLHAALTFLVTNYLGDYGVTLHGSQVTGPTLPELTYEYRKLNDVLDELATLTADAGAPYVWNIDHFKVLRMHQPSTTAAPFNVTDTPPNPVIGDIEVESTRAHYANRVVVKIPSRTEMGRNEVFTGDGTTSTFQLTFVPFWTRGVVNVDGIDETLGPVGDPPATWWLDSTANTITRMPGPPANGAVITLTMNGTFSGVGIAEDAAEIAAVGIYEMVVIVENVPSETTAQALADAYLARSLAITKTVKYRTLETGLLPGQSQTITIARRNLSGASAVISDVVTRDIAVSAGSVPILERAVTAIVDATQTNLGRGFRDVYRLWAGDRAGSGTAVTTGTGTAISGPSGPEGAVQYMRGGAFGGESEFIYYEATNSLLCGGGGSGFTAADIQSCQIFGYNNHIGV